MAMKHLQDIQSIFSTNLFTVPDYQRGYAWEELQWQDLWDDLEALEPGQAHYTGTLVLHVSSDGTVSDDKGAEYTKFNVVDGQQRLTTLSIFLNEMAREFDSIKDTKIAEGIRDGFISTTRHNVPLPKLQLNKDTNEFYHNNIISDGGQVAGKPKIKSEERLAEAQCFFRGLFEKKRTDMGDAYPGWLHEMRKKVVSKMLLTVYEVPNVTDVGVIFEVMNNRGKPLTDMEKVKNYLLYLCAKLEKHGGEELANEINSVWKNIYETIMDCGGFGWMEDALLRYNWLVSRDHRSKEWKGSNSVKNYFNLKDYKGKFPELQKKVRQYVVLLRDSCKAFSDIIAPKRDKAFDTVSNPALRKKIIEFSEKLIRLNTTATFAPLLMAFRLKIGRDKPEEYLRMLQLCEKYAFRVFRMMERRANAGQTRLYKTAFDFFNGTLSVDTAYNEVHALLTRFCPQKDYEAAVEKTGDNWYAWYGAKYLLYEYELYLAAGAHILLDWETFQRKDKKESIEHILPQTPDGAYWKKHWRKPQQIKEAMHDIGNLVVTLDNSSYGNKGFDVKKGKPGESLCYANSSLFSEKALCKYTDWNYDAFKKRRAELEAWMKNHWAIEDYIDASTSAFDEEEDDE